MVNDDRPPSAHLLERIECINQVAADASVIAIDIPIGLLDKALRQADERPELRSSALSSDSVASMTLQLEAGSTSALVDVLSSRIASAVHATRLDGSRHTGHVV